MNNFSVDECLFHTLTHTLGVARSVFFPPFFSLHNCVCAPYIMQCKLIHLNSTTRNGQSKCKTIAGILFTCMSIYSMYNWTYQQFYLHYDDLISISISISMQQWISIRTNTKIGGKMLARLPACFFMLLSIYFYCKWEFCTLDISFGSSCVHLISILVSQYLLLMLLFLLLLFFVVLINHTKLTVIQNKITFFCNWTREKSHAIHLN